jgi:transposase
MAAEAIPEEESILPYGAISGTLEIDRDKLLNMLSDVLTSQHYKITKGRIRDAKSEKIKLDSVRVLAYLCSVYNGILKDRDLTDIERRVEALENAKQKP